MERKNVIKISLSTFLLILAIIAIIVMGIFIYKLNNDKIIEIQKSTELQSQVNSLNGTVSDLQGKINSISETINSNSSNNTTDENKQIGALSENEAKKLLEEKYNLAIQLYSVSTNYFEISNDPFERSSNDYICLIKNYDDVVNSNFSDNMKSDFEKNATCLIIFQDKYWIEEGGGGFSTYGGIEEFKNIEIANNKISSIVKTKHIDGEGNFQGYNESNFTIIKSGNNWLIDNFNSSDLD